MKKASNSRKNIELLFKSEAINFIEIYENMNEDRAEQVRHKRVELGMTWRRIAEVTHKEWESDACWEPDCNQLAGMDLCYVASLYFNENHYEEPWN